MFLLDTDIATLAVRGHERVTARLAREERENVAIPVATRLEMLRGRIDALLKAPTATDVLRAVVGLAVTEAFLARFRIVPLAERAAQMFERFKGNKKLKKVGHGDLL